MSRYLSLPFPADKDGQLVRWHRATRIAAPVRLAEVPPATRIAAPVRLAEVPPGKALVCVVRNEAFDAAALIRDEAEFEAFSKPDGRRKVWLMMAKERAFRLAGMTD